MIMSGGMRLVGDYVMWEAIGCGDYVTWDATGCGDYGMWDAVDL